MNNKKKTWEEYYEEKGAAIDRAAGGEEAVGLTLMKQERGFEDTPDRMSDFESRDFSAEEKKKLGLPKDGNSPSWLTSPPEGYKVVKARARGAQQAINQAKQGHPATGAGEPGGSYYEEVPGGYIGYALVPAN